MSVSQIFLSDPQETPPRITQLFPFLELFSAGTPAANSLFIMAPAPLAGLVSGNVPDQLLIVDPPADVTTRFRLEGNVAALFTGPAADVGLPLVESRPGGVAHLRIGDHFLDLYGQPNAAIVFLPAVGVICGGSLGSDASLPRVAAGSDGNAELETLRLLARLLKRKSLQYFIPAVGSPATAVVEVMERLAADVAYLHGLRRVLPGAMARGDSLETIEVAAEALLPANRDNAHARTVHEENVQRLVATCLRATEE